MAAPGRVTCVIRRSAGVDRRTFGELIAAQAAGDSAVLAEHGRPVVTLTVSDAAAIAAVIAAAS